MLGTEEKLFTGVVPEEPNSSAIMLVREAIPRYVAVSSCFSLLLSSYFTAKPSSQTKTYLQEHVENEVFSLLISILQESWWKGVWKGVEYVTFSSHSTYQLQETDLPEESSYYKLNHRVW